MLLVDRLVYPISESQLVTLLQRNLRPFLRKELFHSEINSVGNLRNLVTRRIAFSEEFNSTYNTRISNRKLNEIDIDEQGINEHLMEHEGSEIKRDQVDNRNGLLCGNCKDKGHKYTECQSERKKYSV